MRSLHGALWIVLLLAGGGPRATAKGVPISHDVGPQRQEGNYEKYSEGTLPESIELFHQKDVANFMDDLVKSWNDRGSKETPKIPLWNPLLVKLIHRYLLSNNPSSRDSMGMFLGAFQKRFRKQSKSRTINADKDKNSFNEKKFEVEREDLKLRVKRLAEHGLYGESRIMEKLSDPGTTDAKLLKQGPNRWMLLEEPGTGDQSMDFTIPLHSLSERRTASNSVALHKRGDSPMSTGTSSNRKPLRVKRAVYSSFQKYYDPFHPLAYPIKDYAKAKKSLLYPAGTTGYYGNPPVYTRKRGKPLRKTRFHPLKTYGRYPTRNTHQNYGSYNDPYDTSNWKLSGKGNYDFLNFKAADTSLYPSFEEFGYNTNLPPQYGFSDEHNLRKRTSNNVDMSSLVQLYSTLFHERARASDARAVAPRIDSSRLTLALGVTQSIRTGMAPVTEQLPTLMQAITTPSVPITARSRDDVSPCDAATTGGSTSKQPCYYTAPTTRASTELDSATTTPCYATHEPETPVPHYHHQHHHHHTSDNYPITEVTTPQTDPIWSEFEIVQEVSWQTKRPRPTVPVHRKINRKFMITASPPLARFKITDPPPYVEQLPEEYSHARHEYPLEKLRNRTRITGTIELRKGKNDTVSYVVKLPFDTGQVPFAIRRLIISKFTDWPRKDGARSGVAVTMDPTCSPWNANCSLPSPSEDGADIIMEVDSALFDKEQFYTALLNAQAEGRTALDLEELEPSWRRNVNANAKQALQAHEEYSNRVDSEGGGATMSPSTPNPLAAEGLVLPSGTPEWLRKIINRFRKGEDWAGREHVDGDGDSAIARLLPASEPYQIGNHIELLPRHLPQHSGASPRPKAASPCFVLIILMSLYVAM